MNPSIADGLRDMRVGVLFDEDYLATSGPIIEYRKAQNWNPLAPGDTPSDLRSFFSQLVQPDGPHEGRFHYVSPNTDLLGWVIERATGRRFADLVSESWQWPVWLTITGAAAFLTIRAIHESESRRTPEGIADTRAGADAYATEKDAESRHLIAAAFAAAIQTDATTKAQDADARHAATMQEVNRIASQPTPAPRHRQITLRQQPEDMQGMMTYATTTPAPGLQNAPARQEAQDAARAAYTPEYTEAPASAPPRPRHAAQTADPALVNMLQTVSDLFDDSATRADDLITIRLPWSARGQWPAETKRAAEQTLRRLDPPLIIAGAGNRYRLNRAAWCKGLAINAIRQNWRG